MQFDHREKAVAIAGLFAQLRPPPREPLADDVASAQVHRFPEVAKNGGLGGLFVCKGQLAGGFVAAHQPPEGGSGQGLQINVPLGWFSQRS